MHSKPRERPQRNSLFDDPDDFEDFSPASAARFVVATADAAFRFAQNSAQPLRNFTVLAVAQGRQHITAYGDEATATLIDIDSAVMPDLVLETIEAVTGRSADYTTPDE